jgi:hypothetical protein
MGENQVSSGYGFVNPRRLLPQVNSCYFDYYWLLTNAQLTVARLVCGK